MTRQRFLVVQDEADRAGAATCAVALAGAGATKELASATGAPCSSKRIP